MTKLCVNETTTIAFTTDGNSVDTYLDGELIGLPEVRDGNNKVSATLKKGTHILVCVVPRTYNAKGDANSWKLDVQIETKPGTKPGSINLCQLAK